MISPKTPQYFIEINAKAILIKRAQIVWMQGIKFPAGVPKGQRPFEKTIPNISSCIEDISQATNDNCLLNLDTGSYVYLICNDEDKTKLTNYYILVTTLNMNEYANTLKEIIKNVLVY